MTKKRQQSGGKSRRLAPKTAVRPRRAAKAYGMNPYAGLLMDPCNGDLNAPSPFEGADGALSIRTVDYVVPGTAPATPFTDVWLFWQPGYSTQVTLANSLFNSPSPGTAQPTAMAVTMMANMMRCKASCVEWIPTGPVALRAGMVGVAYSPAGNLWNPTQPYDLSRILSSAQRTDCNGSCRHEVRWIPSHKDGDFSNIANNSPTNNTGNAAVGIMIKGVDCTAGVPNGYFKITSVWEYFVNPDTPAYKAAPAAIPRPPPYTLNMVLRSVPNALALAIDMVGHGGAGRPVLQAASRLLGAGPHYNATPYGQQAFGGGRRLALEML